MPSFHTDPAHRLAKACWLTLGCVSLVLGTIGILLPILPTVPFYMLTLCCFAKSSERLHRWFLQSELYQDHLALFIEKRAMPLKTKLVIIGTVTSMMVFAAWMAISMPWLQILLALVWSVHILYFTLAVKTER